MRRRLAIARHAGSSAAGCGGKSVGKVGAVALAPAAIGTGVGMVAVVANTGANMTPVSGARAQCESTSACQPATICSCCFSMYCEISAKYVMRVDAAQSRTPVSAVLRSIAAS